ncbi:universal stress protein [Lentilactobacillus kosonis]|uniref:Universal stress protein UspA and related nucleotide-binding proteins n=1 Tax=Lentilactobacillus kosonis TaxID=2810561 RepID=A0A401FKD8_9LACO|nr:universal stress protein [Lentilactobacillus kosonis]GAY72797.1 universal stress protein UspA and related nucleotide-binding proteins [Lentilactobacillus kosonis]
MFKNIAVTLDGSENSNDALIQAVDIAKTNNANLTLVSVVNETSYYYMGNAVTVGATPLPTDMKNAQRNAAQKILDKSQAYCMGQGVTASMKVEEGIPKRVIVDAYSREKGYDLLVIGKSGTDAISRVLMGSTTAYVVRNATTTVMVVG